MGRFDQSQWYAWFVTASEPLSRDPLPADLNASLAGPAAMHAAFEVGEYPVDYARRLCPTPPSCSGCGKTVEESRRSYAVPTCYSCLPPPPSLRDGKIPPEVFETPGPPDPTGGVRRALREDRDSGR